MVQKIRKSKIGISTQCWFTMNVWHV